MMKYAVIIISSLALAGCGSLAARLGLDKRTNSATVTNGEGQTRPQARGDGAVVPPANATTAEEFDTTSAAERADAAASAAGSGKALGRTVASLGSPSEPGFWLKTPLVTSEVQGRVTNPATGKSAAVTLIPIEGPVTAGSRMSLPAMRLIGANLGALTEVEVSIAG
ncbi:MAG: hypothetical protein WBC93_05185 [Sulfitobacter sp.]